MCARRLRDATSVAGLAEWPKDDCADRETSSRESSSRGRVANASDAMAIVVKTSESSSQARNVHNSKLYFSCRTRHATLFQLSSSWNGGDGR